MAPRKTPAQKSKDPTMQLAEAFRLFAEEGMDDLDQVEQVLGTVYDPQYASDMRKLIEDNTKDLEPV